MNTLGAAARAGRWNASRAQRHRGVRPWARPAAGARRARAARADDSVRPHSASTSRRTPRASPAATTCPCRRCGSRRSSGSHVAEPDRSTAAAAGRAGACVGRTRRSSCCTPTTPRARWSQALVRAPDGPFNVVGPGAASPWQAVRLGQPHAGAGRRSGLVRCSRVAELAGLAGAAARARGAAARAHRRRRARRRGARARLHAPTQEVVPTCTRGPASPRCRTPSRGWHEPQRSRARTSGTAERWRPETMSAARRRPQLRDRRRPAARDRLARRVGAPPGRRPLRGRRVRRRPAPAWTSFSPIVGREIRVDVQHGERIPRTGAALLVSNRGLGVAEPFVLAPRCTRRPGAVSRSSARPSCRWWRPFTRKLGGIGSRPGDVAAVLRAGHLAAAPLGTVVVGLGRGRAAASARRGDDGLPGGPGGDPARRAARMGLWPCAPWRVSVGEPLLPPAGTPPGDPLAAAELAEASARRGRWHCSEEGAMSVKPLEPTAAHGRLRRLRQARRRAAADDPGTRHRLARLGAAADVVGPAVPVLRRSTTVASAHRRTRLTRSHSSRWRATRCPCSTPKAWTLRT